MVNKYLKGGKSEGMTLSQVAKVHNMNAEQLKPQLNKGIKHELEHTHNLKEARRIALDHLVEFPDYYDRLDKIEKMHLGGDMSKHLAPNGKPSNLTHEQWHLVRTPEFKAWFGDWENDPQNASKVVDDNGEPLVVYHATYAKFNEFSIISKYNDLQNETNWSIGSHFGNISQAKSIAEGMDLFKIKEYFLNIRNLERVFDYQTWTKKEWQKNLIGLGYIKEKKTNYTFNEIWDVIQKNKLDGFVYKNRYEGGGNSYVVLNPNQIKLADGTNTTFDGNNPDIRFEKGGLIAPNGKQSNLTPQQYDLVRTPEFKAWFGDWENDPENASKVVDENGEPLVVHHGSIVETNFDIFDYQKADLGFHFGTEEQAKNRVESKGVLPSRKSIVNSFFLNIRVLFEMSDAGEWQYPQRYVDELMSDNIIEEKVAKQKGFLSLNMREDNAIIRDYLKSKYGNSVGFVYNNKYEGKGKSFIVLSPNEIKLADGSNTTFDGENPDIRFDKGGEIENLIDQGEIELKVYPTTPKHANLYGLKSENPLYIQTIFISENQRLKGIGKKVLKYLNDFAIENGHDVMFGHITQKASFSKDDSRESNLDDVAMIKNWLQSNGYEICEGNNDFYKVVNNPDIRFEKGGLIAPNGKSSNLTPQQYDLVRTPEFKAWFGDWENDPENASKVVDENGEPLVVYHGTKYTQEFYEFDLDAIPDENVKAFFFSKGYEHAKRYTFSTGSVKPFFLKAIKLFDPKSLSMSESKKIRSILNESVVKDFIEYNYLDGLDEWKSQYDSNMSDEDFLFYILTKTDSSWGVIELQVMQDYLKSNNYNGFITYEQVTNQSTPNLNYAVFESNQIKLADGTNTTFDSGNPDIRFDKGGLIAPNGKPSNLTPQQYDLVRTPEFKAWFGDWENDPENASKVVDENGEPLVLWHYSRTLKNEVDKFYIFNVDKELGSHFGLLKQSQYLKYQSKDDREFDIVKEEVSDFRYYQVFLNIRNPIRLKDVGVFKLHTLINAIGEENIEDNDWLYIHTYNEKSQDTDIDRAKYIAKSKFGYDGAVYLNRYESDAKVSFIMSLDEVSDKTFKTKVPSAEDSWIAFEPNQIKLADGTNTTFDGKNPDIRFDKGGRTIAQTPAPASDRVYGSKTNPKGSASDSELAKSIKFNDKLEKAIQNKVDEFNDKHPSDKVSLSTAKAIVRRGMGAYSKSHRPTISGGAPNSRQAWGLARLNKFLLKKSGVKVKKAYVQDDDLLKYAKGGKINMGDCYEVAGRMALMEASKAPNGEIFLGQPKVVHGEVAGQGSLEGIRYGHAWVEDDVYVYDFSNGRELMILKEVYYYLGKIMQEKPKLYKYTFKEATKKMVESRNFGPWDLITESGL